MLVFWERGFENAHLDDLLESTGMVRSSFYRTFGSKENLFSRVIERYERDFMGFRQDALSADSAAEVISQLLHGLVDLYTDPKLPAGCLGTTGAVAASPEAESVRRMLFENRDNMREELQRRLAELAVERPMPLGMTPASVANLVATMIQGLAVMAKGGMSRKDLTEAVDNFLAAIQERPPVAP